MKYLTVLLNKKNSSWLAGLYAAIKDCYECFSGDFLEQTLLPRLYLCLRSKTANCEVVVEGLVKLISRDSNSALINTYASKINAELSKSSRSYEREIAVLFFYFGKDGNMQPQIIFRSSCFRSIAWAKNIYPLTMIKTSRWRQLLSATCLALFIFSLVRRKFSTLLSSLAFWKMQTRRFIWSLFINLDDRKYVLYWGWNHQTGYTIK